MDPFIILPPTPAGLGFNPAKFPVWRPQQLANVSDLMDTTNRVTVSNMPVGSGKSLTYVAYAVATGSSSVICTVSNALLTQLAKDFPGHVAVIKGRSNYRCAGGYQNCKEGAESGCEHRRTPSCDYYSHYCVARDSKIVATNYAYHMHIKNQGEGLGKRDLLILDEGHEIPELVCGHKAVQLSYDQAGLLGSKGPVGDRGKFTTWSAWSESVLGMAIRVHSDATSAAKAHPDADSYRQYYKTRAVLDAVQSINTAATNQEYWAVDGYDGAGGRWWYTLTPVWPQPYVERILFQGIPQVLVYSATFTPHTVDMLGMPPGEVTYLDYESTFPLQSMPFIHIPTVALRKGASSQTLQTWINRIDEIIDGRLDRKGIIHTGSYGRAQDILSMSRHSGLMIGHESKGTARAIDAFMRAPAPAILVSPVVTTGYDFGGPLAEYQIISKVPYPPVQSNLMRARMGRDYPEYSPERIQGDNYQAGLIADSISQTAGRIMRFPADRGETFIVDSNMGFFMRSHRRLFTRSFLRTYSQMAGVPRPPKPSLYELAYGPVTKAT